MTEPTPADRTLAEQLHAAARILRETNQTLYAEAKPPQQPLMWFAEDLIAGATLTITGGDAGPADHQLTPGETRWIAIASPDQAELWAELLEAVAGLLDLRPILARQHVDGTPCDSPTCRIVHHTAAIARKILQNTERARDESAATNLQTTETS